MALVAQGVGALATMEPPRGSPVSVTGRLSPSHQTTSVPAATYRTARASSYGIGDGFLGGRTACGGRLDATHFTVAYRYLHTSRAELKCGSTVEICYGRRCHAATVTDAGPFVGGRLFDLGPALCRYLKACGIPVIRWRRL